MHPQEITQRQVILAHEENVNVAFAKFDLWPSPSARENLIASRKRLNKAKRELTRIRKEIKAAKTSVKKEKDFA
jgi:ABC-type arginine transport system ATPase subunit